MLQIDAPPVENFSLRLCILTSMASDVTMGWLLRLVTGGTGGRGPPTVLEFLAINFSVCYYCCIGMIFADH